MTSPRIGLAASPESIARASEAFNAFAALPRGHPLSCAPPEPDTPIIPVAFRASAGEVVAEVWTDGDPRCEAGTRRGGVAAAMEASMHGTMHGAASAMFQSAMSFLRESTRGGERESMDVQWGESMDGERESTDGSVPPARVAVDDRRRRDLRGATVSLVNARVFSATAMCGDPGANLLTVNAEGFDLTRGVPSRPAPRPRAHRERPRRAGGRAGFDGGTRRRAGRRRRGVRVRVRRGGQDRAGSRGRRARLEGVLEDLRVAAADVVAAAASKDDPGDEETLPYHASLDVRESAVVLVGVVGGDGEDATLDGGGATLDPKPKPLTLNHGVVRLDVLRVAVIPGESTGVEGVGSESPSHPASRGSP